ncbi:MAG: preprotein translocase subunit YajC [Saprospiraceae bacterium]|jgi:preprotein translocase subunit YajC|nr:preprotein translocase subunit YajC [Saprospiraceae bacterium]MBK8633483.1 preprotein translocase subunit YajC [Saprospiraceae bacterium]MBP7644745.1 preprotein translocase subunit YajC [Saprospiraceae bacterium]HMS69256.1 preprotein translocase subunit YajC [Saprospiraceae bacterium]HOY13718.1 preprotein translocase subunit YajC [Saprospiraceae bacterium]
MLSFVILQSSSSSIIGMLPLLLMFVIMYFFFIRPQVKKQKEQTSFIGGIKKGDEVVTSSGLIGKIDSIVGEEVTIQADSKTFLKFTKGAISKEMTESYLKSKGSAE